MARTNHTQRLARTEEALTVLFCLIDDAYAPLNPRARCYESIKRLGDSEVIALALFQQLRGVESERSFLRDAERFFSHLFPGVVGLAPSSFHRRVRKLRRFLEPLRRAVLGDLMYWGKKILEWSNTPEHAYKTTLYLNNKYFLDGRDPNSFANVAWVFGQHDRGWTERAVYGKVRYMSAGGLERKSKPEKYVEKVEARVSDSG